MVRISLPASGPPVAAPPLLAWTLVLDLCVAAGLAVVGALALLRVGPGSGLGAGAAGALVAYGAALFLADLAAARLSPKGLLWRRRLGYLALVALAWRGGPFSASVLPAPFVVVVVAWVGAVWVALVVGGRALSRAIAGVTHEDAPTSP